jgi:phosphate:Na+ symporter
VAERLDHAAPHGNTAAAMQPIHAMRQSIVASTSLPAEDRGALLALLGSAERAFFLAERIQSERASVSREIVVTPSAERGAGGALLTPQGA